MEKIEIIPDSIQLIKMTDEEYFSEKYKDYISNSRLGLINPDQGGSVDLYKQGAKSEYSDSFELGSVVHALTLQPEYYNISDIRKPSGKLGQFADKVFQYEKSGILREHAIKAASLDAKYYAEQLTEKRLETALTSCTPYWKQRAEWESTAPTTSEVQTLFISDVLAKRLYPCLQGIKREPKIEALLCPVGFLETPETFNEYAILAEVDVTIDDVVVRLKIKAKLDNFTADHELKVLTLNDLKTTGKPLSFFMGNYVKLEGLDKKVWYDGSFQTYHYGRQMGAYLWLLNCVMHFKYNLDYSLRVNMLVVETSGAFNSGVYPVTKKQVLQGLEEFKKLLILVAKNG